ncbi:MAG: hypothetical protein ACRDSR_22730 [Pseudonocardiaceae bacterium]
MKIGQRIMGSAIHNNGEASRIRRRRVAAAGAIAFTLGFVPALVGIGMAPAAYAGSTRAPDCKPQGTITAPGAEARWTKCIGDGWTSVDGWVSDTREDGKCAEVFARFANGAEHHSKRACPKGDVERFSWKESGSGVSVLLRTVPAG